MPSGNHVPESAGPVRFEDVAEFLGRHLALDDVSVVTVGLGVRDGGVDVRLHQVGVAQVPPVARDVLQMQGGVKVVILWSGNFRLQ